MQSNVIGFQEYKEQKQTMDKIKQSNVSAASFDAMMGNPLEAIDKMIGDLKPKEKETK